MPRRRGFAGCPPGRALRIHEAASAGRRPRRRIPRRGVAVVILHPGSVRTEFWDEARIPPAGVPPLVRLAPKIPPAAVARAVLWCIRLRMASRTLPFFVAFLARANALWARLGDLLLWRWFVPVALGLVTLKLLFL